MAKILIFFDHDVTIRHFLKSGSFSEIYKKHDVETVFYDSGKEKNKFILTDLKKLDLKTYEEFYVSRKRLGKWYHIFVPSVLNINRRSSYYKAVFEQMKTSHKNKIFWFYWLMSLPIFFYFYKKFILFFNSYNKDLEKFILEKKPDLIIHPSLLAGMFVNDLSIIAKLIKIPFLLLMNSWDNCSNKASLAENPTILGVWGPQSYSHAKTYLGMNDENIEIVGPAQFDIYKHGVRKDKKSLHKKFKVPLDKKIFVFCGGSKGFKEIYQLQILDEAISLGKIPKIHILYRPHPWRGTLIDEPFLLDLKLKNVSLDPTMRDFYTNLKSKPYPGLFVTDYQDSKDLLDLVSGVLSPLSTMLIEAILNGKPCITIFPDKNKDLKKHNFTNILKELVYFKEFISNDLILTCDDSDTLINKTNELIKLSKNI